MRLARPDLTWRSVGRIYWEVLRHTAAGCFYWVAHRIIRLGRRCDPREPGP